MTRSSSVPPPTPQAERMLAPRPQRKMCIRDSRLSAAGEGAGAGEAEEQVQNAGGCQQEEPHHGRSEQPGGSHGEALSLIHI